MLYSQVLGGKRQALGELGDFGGNQNMALKMLVGNKSAGSIIGKGKQSCLPLRHFLAPETPCRVLAHKG